MQELEYLWLVGEIHQCDQRHGGRRLFPEYSERKIQVEYIRNIPSLQSCFLFKGFTDTIQNRPNPAVEYYIWRNSTSPPVNDVSGINMPPHWYKQILSVKLNYVLRSLFRCESIATKVTFFWGSRIFG